MIVSAPHPARASLTAALLALITLAVYPILSGGLPVVGDGLNHFYRFAELDWHVRHGDFYPRWFANLGYGFGMPVLNFYSPLTYYIPLVFRLAGLSLDLSLQLGYVLALALAVTGAWAWGRQLFDSEAAGLLAGGAYGLAPYFYFNIFHRGAYPETWALAIAPWLLWAAGRMAARPDDRRAHAALISLFAALILTHTLSALIFSPVLGCYLLGLLFFRASAPAAAPDTSPRGRRISTLLRAFIIDIALALALTAFFTLPVFFESQFIQLQRAYSTGDLDYHRNFLSLTDLFPAPPNYDPDLVFNVMPPGLGWPQGGLALAALLWAGWAWRRPADQQPWQRPTLLLAGLAAALGFLTLSAAAPLWSLFPFVRFIQFPWRLAGPASLALAGLAAACLARGSEGRVRGWLAPASLAACFFFSLAWTYHANFTTPAYASPADSVAYEVTSGQLGTASTAEYLPGWATQLPDPAAQAAGLVSRLQPLPSSITYTASQPAVNREELTYTAPAPFTAAYNLFYFPGWAASLDDAPLELQPAPATGLIIIALPAGSHTLRLYRQLTPPELAGVIVSLAALAGLLVLAWRWRPQASPAAESHGPAALSARLAWASAGLCLLLLGARAAYLDRTETLFHHRNPIPNPLSVNFGGQLELIGVGSWGSLVSGGRLPLTLYWRALRPLQTDYSVSVQLADRFGQRFGQSDSQHPNGVPTSRWALDQYARDTHTLLALTGAPPGDYRLMVTVYGARPLSILQNDAPAGIDYDLGPVRVGLPTPEPPGPLALADHTLAASAISVGDQLAFTAVWFSGDQPPAGLRARIELIDPAGRSLLRADQPPAGPDYPSERWRPDTYVRYPYRLTLPPDLPAGAARVRLSLVAVDGTPAAGPVDLGPITVSAPPRVFTIPAMQVRVDHDYAGSIRLLGYDRTAGSITLYWQSLKAVTVRLTVFVHTLDTAGAFVNGHDAAPARPTTGWLPGEVITDVHPISLGNHIEVGLYDPNSGERFGEIFVTQP